MQTEVLTERPAHSHTGQERRASTLGGRQQAAREPGEIAATGQEASAQPSARRGEQTATGRTGEGQDPVRRDVGLVSETAVLHGT